MERRLDLDPDKITRILETILMQRISAFQPLVPNDDQKNLAPSHCFFQMLFKINSSRNGIYILKDCCRAEMHCKTIVDAARDIGTVCSTVGNKNPGRSGRLGFC